MHSRAHYDEMDAMLASAAEHIAEEYLGTATPADRAASMATSIVPDLVMRLYRTDGGLVAESPNAASVPATDPRTSLAGPSRPAFDAIAGLAPAFAWPPAGHGRFDVTADRQGNRWRLHVLPLASLGQILVVAAPLDRIDASVARFRGLLLGFAVVGTLLTFMVSWLLARGALHPLAVVTATASAIARSRGFGRRVPVGPRDDELGQLTTTFNEMLDSLEQAYRAEQRFVGDASHELRAPLTAIQANLELLERRPDMPVEARQEAVAEASREAHRLTQLVADLLALARADAGAAIPRHPVELDRVLLDTLGSARHLARGRRLDIAALDPTVVEGNEDRLRQLLLILLDNAIKYSPPDGTVTLSLRRNGRTADLTVADRGVGIPPDELPRVFDRFYRADPARARDPGGTGLGLSIAHWIVEQHGGQIGIESAVGRGTTVSVTLPTNG
ncbi:MAG: HAMP domain-containing histidine kinase [Chloroflexi bacterium]|nr:HAMP domain-containing histidine kinase [Chloroflexota bacterium]